MFSTFTGVDPEYCADGLKDDGLPALSHSHSRSNPIEHRKADFLSK